MKRRDFLTTVTLAAGGTLAQAARAQVASKKASLNCFSKSLQWLDYDALAEMLALAGYGGIDLTVRPKGHVSLENVEQDLPRAVEAARKQGLKIEMIVTSIASASDPLADRVLKTAAQCGVKVYRMGYLRYDDKRSVEDELEKLRGTFEAFEKLNRACGLTGCYQNHAGMSERNFGGVIWDLHTVLKGLDPQWIGCQYDIHHAFAEISDSWVTGMRLIEPYIRSTCLKDFSWMMAEKRQRKVVFGGEGVVPWKRYFELVKEFSVKGPATVHCEWELFTKAEQVLPEAERRAVALRKLKHECDFFTSQYAKHGIVR
ncbi:MAG: TIM barrel protein [Kiritimatiellia bacterium]